VLARGSGGARLDGRGVLLICLGIVLSHGSILS
jgi:hypothetical protein